MSSVGGAAWKTEEEIAAHIITEKKQVQDHPEDRLQLIAIKKFRTHKLDAIAMNRTMP